MNLYARIPHIVMAFTAVRWMSFLGHTRYPRVVDVLLFSTVAGTGICAVTGFKDAMTIVSNEGSAMLAESTVRDVCTDAVFERAETYRDEGRIRRCNRFDDVLTAAVKGTELYDVTVDIAGGQLNAQCTCPYMGQGECKHVVAVLLEAVYDPPADESERVDAVLDDVPCTELCAFVREALAEHPRLRDRFVARFSEASLSVQEVRDAIESLFERHAGDSLVITTMIDFSPFFDVAEQYRARERYRAAADVYRALFEAIDANMERIDTAYEHYTATLRAALDGYVDCVRATDLSRNEVERRAAVLADRARTSGVHTEAFQRACNELRSEQ